MGRKEPLFYVEALERNQVEIGDEVDCEIITDHGAMDYRGEVTAISPRNAQVRVLYTDPMDFVRSTGEPRVKSTRLPIANVTLLARGS